MDQNHPAWLLAEAAAATLRGDHEALDNAFAQLKPTTRTIAQAYALGLTTQPFQQSAANHMIIETRLQVALMEEHVAAQRRMGRTLNVLTVVLVVLTFVLVCLGMGDLGHRFHWFA